MRVTAVPTLALALALCACSRTSAGSHAGAHPDVVIYGASWCTACDKAAAFFDAHHVRFVERDIEEDHDAYDEMMRKARAAGLRLQGIPLIDFRGTLVPGFDARRLEALLAASPTPKGASGGVAGDRPPPGG